MTASYAFKDNQNVMTEIANASFEITVQPSGRAFATQGTETILAAAIRTGVGLPYGTWPSLLLLAAIWAVVMPVLHGFARLYRAQYEHSQQARQSA